MTEKYPYLNSVVFDNPKLTNETHQDNHKSENSSIYDSNNCMFNIDDQFQDVDLNGSENSFSDSPNNSGMFQWRLCADSMEILSDNNESNSVIHTSDSFVSSFPKNVLTSSSISSLSSVTSTTDLSFPFPFSTIDSSKPLQSRQNGDESKLSSRGSVSTANKDTKSNIISQFSQLLRLSRPHPRKSPIETPVKSTTCLILNDRPMGLPPKSSHEEKRHQDEYHQLICSIKKRERQESQAKKVKQKSKLNHEERQYQLTNVWRNFIIPNWFHQRSSQYVRHLWWEGIPTSVRDKVWKQCIPNTLKLTKTHYDNFLSQMQERIERYLEPVTNDLASPQTTNKADGEVVPCTLRIHSISSPNNPTTGLRSSAYDIYISETVSIHSKRSSSHSFSSNLCPPHNRKSSQSSAPSSDVDIRQILLNTIKLDVSRTFPHLNLFQNGFPHHDLLYQLLGAYACYRPDIGYVQGMSFLAAVLILVMNVEDAFICFSNILELPCHHAFYALDESEFNVYLESFKLLLFTHLPQLAQHFTQHKLDVNIFLCDWLFTIYSRTLPLETALRVWDMFCRDGEAALFRAGLGILRCYEMQLLNSDFEEMASFLTGQMPESLTAYILVDEMREIKLNQSNFVATIEEVRSRLIVKKSNTAMET